MKFKTVEKIINNVDFCIVEHGGNTINIMVTILDNNNREYWPLFPDGKIVINDLNSVTIWFGKIFSGRVEVLVLEKNEKDCAG